MKTYCGFGTHFSSHTFENSKHQHQMSMSKKCYCCMLDLWAPTKKRDNIHTANAMNNWTNVLERKLVEPLAAA
jgi:hypothetical protein